MSDDKKTPPLGAARQRFPSPVRGTRAITEKPVPPSSPERDRLTYKHRDAPSPVPFRAPDEITGQYEGEELQRIRSKRPTDERIARLERKHDSLDAKVDRIEVSVATISGKMDVLPQLITNLSEELKARRDDDHVVLTTKLDVGRHEAISRIDTAAIAIKNKWKIALKIVGALTSASVIGAVIATLAQRC